MDVHLLTLEWFRIYIESSCAGIQNIQVIIRETSINVTRSSEEEYCTASLFTAKRHLEKPLDMPFKF